MWHLLQEEEDDLEDEELEDYNAPSETAPSPTEWHKTGSVGRTVMSNVNVHDSSVYITSVHAMTGSVIPAIVHSIVLFVVVKDLTSSTNDRCLDRRHSITVCESPSRRKSSSASSSSSCSAASPKSSLFHKDSLVCKK